jgi:DNA-binding response OmpR family regulator
LSVFVPSCGYSNISKITPQKIRLSLRQVLIAFKKQAMKKILVVEDDRGVQTALRRLFEAEHYLVEVTPDGKAGLDAFRSAPPCAVVLDLRLPGLTGSDVCREIKKEAPSLPVIVLSAKSDIADKVLLLELGADDYVTKPFSPRELLARVRAAVRRASRSEAGDLFTFGNVTADFAKMELTRNGQLIPMTAHEFKLLKFFTLNPGRVISRSELLNEVWGYQEYPSTRTVDNHIWKLRLKLEDDPGNPQHFETVHGAGYKFVPEHPHD